MIDTVKIKSPVLEENLAKHIEQKAFIRQGIDMVTGDLVYQITTLQLKGTYESAISVRIEKGTWEYCEVSKTVKKFGDEYYMIVECSLNKVFYGHNVFGGSDDLRQFKLLLRLLEIGLECKLPDYSLWTLMRLDYAEEFDLGEKNVYNYCINLNNSYYGRRNTDKFGKTGVYFAGTTTTLKFYAKGKEFTKHDRKRLKELIIKEDLKKIQKIANGILRVEVEIKGKKIKYDLNKTLQLHELDMEYFKNIYQIEVEKVLRLNEDNQYFYKADDVKQILFSKYTRRKANTLYGTYLKLSLEGELKAKETMSSSTFYEHRKELVKNNISWHNTIIEKREDNIVDFLPYLDSKYKLDYQDNRLEFLYTKYNIS